MRLFTKVVLLATFAGFVGCSANAAPETITGIHVRYVGTSPHAVKAQETLNKAMSGMCAKQGMTFKMNGPVEKIGDSVTNEYFAPSHYYSASYKSYYVVVQNSLCESTVTQLTKTLIYHLNAPPQGGGVLYEYRSGGKSPGWSKRALPSLGLSAMVVDTAESSAITGGAKVMVAGKDMYAGQSCKVSKVFMPGGGMLSDSCEMPVYKDTDKKIPLAFPVRLKLAGSQYLPESGELVSRTVAESVNLKSALPASLFLPPEDAFKAKPGTTTKRNATSKWCDKQEQKTGVNPCKNGDEAGDN